MDEFINNVGLKIVLKTFMSSSNNLQEDSCVKHESFPCLTWCVLSIETTWILNETMCWENVKFEFVMLSVPQINTGWRRLAVIIFKYCDDQML